MLPLTIVNAITQRILLQMPLLYQIYMWILNVALHSNISYCTLASFQHVFH